MAKLRFSDYADIVNDVRYAQRFLDGIKDGSKRASYAPIHSIVRDVVMYNQTGWFGFLAYYLGTLYSIGYFNGEEGIRTIQKVS